MYDPEAQIDPAPSYLKTEILKRQKIYIEAAIYYIIQKNENIKKASKTCYT